MRRRLVPLRVLTLLIVIGTLPATATLRASPRPAAAPQDYRSGFEHVGRAPIRAWARFLASAELQGRGTGQHGYGVAARYVASVLEGLGVEPASPNSTYFQDLVVVKRRGLKRGVLTATNLAGTVEEIALARHVALDGPSTTDWNRPWICAGVGDAASLLSLKPEHDVVLLVPREAEIDAAIRAAQSRGARRLVVASDERVRKKRGVRGGWAKTPRLPSGASEPVVIYLAESIVDRLLAFHGLTIDALRTTEKKRPPFALSKLTLRMELEIEEERLRTRNVLGKWVGRDPLLRSEFVGVGAHLDHLGVEDGETFLGADDNASGVSAALAVAHGLVANGQRPRRSVIFMFFAAEEIGLHGSRYFVAHPPFPLEQLVGSLHMDMIGRNEESTKESAAENERTLHVVGARQTSGELDAWLHDVNRYVDLSFEYDLEKTVYRRSDHYSFARRGVPVAFFFAGFHPDYHRVSDTVEKLNYDKIYRVSRLVYALTYEIAEREQRLSR